MAFVTAEEQEIGCGIQVATLVNFSTLSLVHVYCICKNEQEILCCGCIKSYLFFL
jgi:hypothetical protein